MNDGKRNIIIVLILTVNLAIAIVALVIALTSIQSSRLHGDEDTCHLITGLVRRGTPPDKLAAATAFLDKSGLSNCHTYAEREIR